MARSAAATAARRVGLVWNWPYDVAVGPDGSLYIADTYGNRIRRVAPSGVISTVVGADTSILGDGGPATAAQLDFPTQVAISSDGLLYIADRWHNRVRVVRPDGIITTAVGNGDAIASSENSPPTATSLYHPEGIALRPDGSLVVADTENNCIRRIGPPIGSSGISARYIPRRMVPRSMSSTKLANICARWMPSPMSRSLRSPTMQPAA